MVTLAVYLLVYRTKVIYNYRKRKMPIYLLDNYILNYNTKWDSPLYAIFGLAINGGLYRTPLLYRAAKTTLYRRFIALSWPFLPSFVWLNPSIYRVCCPFGHPIKAVSCHGGVRT
jgi:hypothetical protein